MKPIGQLAFILLTALLLLTSGFAARLTAKEITLSNDQITASWRIRDQMLWPDEVVDHASGNQIEWRGELFNLVLTNGGFIHAAGFKLTGPVEQGALPVNPDASRLAERLPGRQLTARLVSEDGNIQLTWHGILRDGSRYLRQEYIFTAVNQPVPLDGIMLLDTPLANARPTGDVDGLPVVTDTAFFGVEHPLSVNRGEMGFVRCFLPRGTALRATESYACSLVAGFADQGQMRRNFLAYLERERAHPYRPFLHYNSWYDLGYGNKYDEAGALRVINAFGQELSLKRGVKLDSFMFDDGWDDNATLWRFHSGFPHGFAPVRTAAEQYGAEPGIWLSPWGGYGKAHDERLQYGLAQGFETRDHNFSLAGPKYYERFRSLCVNVVTNYGVNHFKFDGIGGGGGAAMRDFDAMLQLIAELRALKPDIYINQTTGTWPSPFWLLHADSIWRGGLDHSFVIGPEPERERWITYKDDEVYDKIVSRSELYPLNSLMLHGIIYARQARGLYYDTNNIFKSEVRAFFGSGTQLQEMYITPELLTAANWDDLAAAANWSRANADVLVDTHWLGGSPGDREVYGWASWSPRKGIFTLRNPSAKASHIEIDAAKIFELPKHAPQQYRLASPFPDQTLDLSRLQAGEPATFKLAPFQVLVVEALPVP